MGIVLKIMLVVTAMPPWRSCSLAARMPCWSLIQLPNSLRKECSGVFELTPLERSQPSRTRIWVWQR